MKNYFTKKFEKFLKQEYKGKASDLFIAPLLKEEKKATESWEYYKNSKYL